MCDCNKNCSSCGILITSNSLRPIKYIEGVDDMGCKAYQDIATLNSGSLTNVSVLSPLTGNGTSASPLDINFSNISAQDLTDINAKIFETTTAPSFGTNVNHPNDYFGVDNTKYLGTPISWVIIQGVGKIPVY